jgi:S1-C subfamily serine protease
MGSGFIYDTTGLVVTAYHVVAAARTVAVEVGGARYDAVISGTSPCDDLAALRIIDPPVHGLPYVSVAEGVPELGTEVLTVGYPQGGDGQGLTRGIVSRTGEEVATQWAYVKDTIQTDAAMNPGVSGGPLATLEGEVIGLNFGGYDPSVLQNVSYAVAGSLVNAYLHALDSGSADPWIGIDASAMTTEEDADSPLVVSGVRVNHVQSRSAASIVGLRRGDIIYTVNGQPSASDGTLRNFCTEVATSSSLSIEVLRGSFIYRGELPGMRLTRLGNVTSPSTPSATRPPPPSHTTVRTAPILSEAVWDDPGYLIFEWCDEIKPAMATHEVAYCNGLSHMGWALSPPAYHSPIAKASAGELKNAYCEGWSAGIQAVSAGASGWDWWFGVLPSSPSAPCDSSGIPLPPGATYVTIPECPAHLLGCYATAWPPPYPDHLSAIWCLGAVDGIAWVISPTGYWLPELGGAFLIDCARR